jgi:hypothetical protein
MSSCRRALAAKTVTVPVPDHRELRVGTLQSIIRQSGVAEQSSKKRDRWGWAARLRAIDEAVEHKGYVPVARRERFIVKGKYGPLREGEIERARAWGAELAAALVAPTT